MVTFVVERECSRPLSDPERHRNAERLEVGPENFDVVGSTPRHDVGLSADSRDGSRSVKDGASGPGRRSGHDVAAEVTDDRYRAHMSAPRVTARGAKCATMLASPNETRKLGTVAPMPQSGGFRLATTSTHHDGPVGYSHW